MTTIRTTLPTSPSSRNALLRGPSRSDAFRFSIWLLLVLSLVVLDVPDFLGGQSFHQFSWVRYMPLLIPVAWVLLTRLTGPPTLIRRATRPDKLLLLLGGWGLVGSLYGKAVLGTEASALPIFATLLIAPLHVFALRTVSEREARRVLVILAGIGFAYIALYALARSGTFEVLSTSTAYGHARVFFIIVGLSAMYLARRFPLLALSGVLAVLSFLLYPAATYPAAVMIGLITLLLTRPRATRIRTYVIGMALLGTATVMLFNFDRSVGITEGYFTEIGKQSNVSTRLDLWEASIEEIAASPIFGTYFTGEMSLPIELSGKPVRVPVHNDYLSLAMAGGLFGVGLFLAWAFATNLFVLSRCRGFVSEGSHRRAAMLRALLVGYNAWLVVALFNPLLQSVATSIPLVVFYGLMMSAGKPAAGGTSKASAP